MVRLPALPSQCRRVRGRLRGSVAGVLLAVALVGVSACTETESASGPPGSGALGVPGPARSGDGDVDSAGDPQRPTGSTPPGSIPAKRPEPPVYTEGRRLLVAAGVPDLAAKAYLNAAARVKDVEPSCVVPPEVLAAFGRQESNHGQVLEWNPDGHSRGMLRGYAETGPDTDGGVLDGDKKYDWAVGAMQFIPTTWKAYAQDGDGDGVADPHDFYDSALTAAWHLCDLAGPFPKASTVAAAWAQYDRSVTAAEYQFKEQHRLWQYRWDKWVYYQFSLLRTPDDQALAAAARQWPDPGKEPVYTPPPIPAGAAQIIGAAERYYGPAGEVRDDYVSSIGGFFRSIASASGDVPYGDLDRVELRVP